MKPELVDARGGDYVVADGHALINMIKNRLNELATSLESLSKRMDTELVNKEEAILLMIAMADEIPLNEKALFFKACVERCAFLVKEHRELRVIGQSFQDKTVYKISLSDAVRFGLK